MTDLLPLFPLEVVLFPGQVLPLHIFEERYRDMVRDLLASPEPREFGVIDARLLDGIGCIAELRDAEPYDDGRYDIMSVGVRRFRVGRLDQGRSYLRGEYEPIEDELPGAAAAAAVPPVQLAFRAYLDGLVRYGGATVTIAELPDEPALLSYVVAAALIIGLRERQSLLAAPDAAGRLGLERELLARETAILRATGSRSAPEVSQAPFSPN
jgi:Lon protease-like protein